MQIDQAKRLKELEAENNRLKRAVAELTLDNSNPERCFKGKLLSAERRRQSVLYVQQRYGLSERRACKALNVSRSVQRYKKRIPDDEEALRSDIIRLARKYGRYGYRRITALLKVEGWYINSQTR